MDRGSKEKETSINKNQIQGMQTLPSPLVLGYSQNFSETIENYLIFTLYSTGADWEMASSVPGLR